MNPINEMLLNDKRIRIIAGSYGSGKTEFAVNYAFALREATDKKISISDLDIVNPYFRSREKRSLLEAKNIHVIASAVTYTTWDLPSVSGEVVTPARTKGYEYIIDLGGDKTGTKGLGRIRPFLLPEETDFFMVINTNRPDTMTAQSIIEQMKELESGAKLLVTGFINNTNLIRETNTKNILRGNEIMKEVSRITNIPVRYHSYIKAFGPLPEGILGEPFPMDFYMREEWM